MTQSYRIELLDGSLVEFNRDQLFLSIYEALAHRKDAVTSASILTDTVSAAIQKQHRLLIPRDKLISTTQEIVKRFDRTGYVRYASMHR